MWVVEELVRGIAAGSLGLSESSGKTSYTMSHSFWNYFSIMLFSWTAWKEKVDGGSEGVSSTRAVSVLNEEEIQKQIGSRAASKCKEEGFEFINVTHYGFVKELSDFSWQ